MSENKPRNVFYCIASDVKECILMLQFSVEEVNITENLLQYYIFKSEVLAICTVYVKHKIKVEVQ